MLFYSADITIKIGKRQKGNNFYEFTGYHFFNFANYIPHSGLNCGPNKEKKSFIFSDARF